VINVHSLFKHNKLRPVAIGRNEQPATGLVICSGVVAVTTSLGTRKITNIAVCKVNCSSQRHCSQVTHNRMGNDAEPTAEFNSIYTVMRLSLKLIRATSIINYFGSWCNCRLHLVER
jgi:hypothetical protein